MHAMATAWPDVACAVTTLRKFPNHQILGDQALLTGMIHQDQNKDPPLGNQLQCGSLFGPSIGTPKGHTIRAKPGMMPGSPNGPTKGDAIGQTLGFTKDEMPFHLNPTTMCLRSDLQSNCDNRSLLIHFPPLTMLHF